MQLEGTHRRLPIYLVIDTSSSMSGAPIESVNAGLRELHVALRDDPHALESAYVSIITFSDSAVKLLSLTEASKFVPPTLTTESQTNLGAAIRLLGQSIDQDVQVKDASHPGDWKPLVFIMTDGHPTDESWQVEIAAFNARRQQRPANVIAIACGSAADVSVLRKPLMSRPLAAKVASVTMARR